MTFPNQESAFPSSTCIQRCQKTSKQSWALQDQWGKAASQLHSRSLPHSLSIPSLLSNRHCNLNEILVPKVYSVPKLCHLLVTWCCHLHWDPLPLEQRARACKEQLCAAPLAEQRGHTVSNRDRSHQLLQGQPIPRGLWHFSGLLCDPGHISGSAAANSLPNPSLSLPFPSSPGLCHGRPVPTMVYSQHDYCQSKTVFSISRKLQGDQDLTKTKPLKLPFFTLYNAPWSTSPECRCQHLTGRQANTWDWARKSLSDTDPSSSQAGRQSEKGEGRSVHHLAVPSSIKNNKGGGKKVLIALGFSKQAVESGS